MAVGSRQRRVVSASMTVEASYVMALTILALAVMIRASGFQRQKTVDVMNLHCAVERLQYREDERQAELPFGRVEREGGRIKGYTNTDKWKKEIDVKFSEPEEILRKLAAFQKREIGRAHV